MENAENDEFKTLEELSLENCPVLFDTSVIVQPLRKGKSDLEYKQVEEKTYFVNENLKFIRQMTGYIKEKKNFLTVRSVIDELSRGNAYGYKKGVKKRGSFRNRPLLKLCRAIRAEEKERRKLIDSFLENERIIKLDEEKEVYSIVYNKYLGILEEFNLSDTDINFFLTGITLAMTSTPVILVSNDFGILKARNRMLVNACLDEESIRFYCRSNFLEFRLLKIRNKNFYTKT